MRPELTYARRALDDLRLIHDRTAEGSPQGARVVMAAIRRTLRFVQRYPALGRDTDEPGIKVKTVPGTAYLIFYALDNGRVLVLHIRHMSRAPVEPGDLFDSTI